MSAIRYLHLAPDASLPPPLSASPFRGILVAEGVASDGWRREVAEWIVRSGCLYFVAWGEDCEVWHDAVDDANLREFGAGAIPDDRFIMTTWHQTDTRAEAMWFAAHAAVHPIVELPNAVIVHVAGEGSRNQLLDEYRAALGA